MNQYLEETIEQYNCLHNSWSKVEAFDETYWRCNDCEATANFPEPKTAPSVIPEWKREMLEAEAK